MKKNQSFVGLAAMLIMMTVLTGIWYGISREPSSVVYGGWVGP